MENWRQGSRSMRWHGYAWTSVSKPQVDPNTQAPESLYKLSSEDIADLGLIRASRDMVETCWEAGKQVFFMDDQHYEDAVVE
jgi:hypothetical protein